MLRQAGVGEPGPEYEDDSLATRRLWNLLKHDEANNKSGESSLENAIDAASEYKDLDGEPTNSRDAPAQGEGARQGAFALFVIASRPWTLASHAPVQGEGAR